MVNNSEPPQSEPPQRDLHSIWPYSYKELLEDFLKAPECLKRCSEKYFSDSSKDHFNRIKTRIQSNPFSKIIFIGNTLNYFASFIPRYSIMKSDKDIKFAWECYELTEFYDYMLPDKLENTLYIFISTSGQSRLLVHCVEHLKLLNVDPDQLWLVTNAKSCRVGNLCGEVFPIHVEAELVLGVRSFQNTSFVLFLLAQLITGEDPASEEILKGIRSLTNEMMIFRKNREPIINNILDAIKGRLEFLYFIARDPASLACAKLNALRIKTYHRQFAEGTTSGLFFHGPFQIFERNEERKLGAIFLVGNKHLDPLKKENSPIIGQSIVDNTVIKEKIGSKHMFIRLVKLLRQNTERIVILSNNKSLHKWFQGDKKIIIVPFNSEIEELAPIFENFILSLVFLRVAKQDKLIA